MTGEAGPWNRGGLSSKLKAMKRMLMASGLLGLLGCSTGSGAARPAGAPFSCEVPGYEPAPRYRADVPMGRLEVVKLATEAPAPAPAPTPAPESERAPFPNTPYRKRPHLPAVRLRVVAEAVPLGTLASAVSRELGVGIVVAPKLVDLRISLSLPETTAEEFFQLLQAHYDVAASSGTAPVIVLEDRLEVLHEHYEVPELLVSVISVKGVPVEDVAAVYCKLMAGERGSAYVIGDTLIVTGESRAQERLRVLLRALQKQDASAPAADAETPP